MKNTELYGTSNTELVTIFRVEYEELQAQSQSVSALETYVDILWEALPLHGISNLVRPPKRATRCSQISSVSCSMKRRYCPA